MMAMHGRPRRSRTVHFDAVTNLFPQRTAVHDGLTCVSNGFRARLAKISGRILNVDELITALLPPLPG